MVMKNHLESVLGEIDINTLEIEDKEYDIKFSRKGSGDKVLIDLESCLDITTPGLNKILGDPACVSTSKVIERDVYEENEENY